MFIGMFKNKTFLVNFCVVFILFFSRESFAQQNESEEVIKPADVAQESQNSTPQTLQQAKHVIVHKVIAHKDIKNNSLSLNELRSIFSLRARKWPDGSAITVFVLRDEHELHRQFLLKTLKMLPHQLRRQWDRFIYSGIGQGPIVVRSQKEMLEKIKVTPGAIGYFEGEEVLDDSVLMLSIR